MSNTLHMFWTSGWDSTYRLLYLSVVAKKEVQPIYIVEYKNRASVELEIETMDLIRGKIKEAYPDAAKLILPTIYQELEKIPIREEISAAYERITRKHFLGGQYVYLSSYAAMSNFDFIELGIIRQGGTYEMLTPLLEEYTVMGIMNYRIAPKLLKEDMYTLFGKFNFPIINYTKTELGKMAEGYGFRAILELSWSCHSPLPGNIPCGICPPCTYAIEQGFEYRFPESSLRRYKKSFKRKLYSQMRKLPGIFHFARNAKARLKGKRNVVG